jgi:methionyl-tRNA formyltransferase
MYRILFFGTSEFAVPSLRSLMQDGRFEVVGIVTQPDRPVGRHATLTAPPIKQALLDTPDDDRIATKEHIFQPEKLLDEPFCSWLKEVGPTCDAFVVVSYGKILPQWLLDLPKKGVINVHGSILPRWRGASPIQAAIAAGDTQSGVTIMQMDALLDHGPIIQIAEEPILPTDTGNTLHDRLALLGATILPSALADYLAGTRIPYEQDHTQATTCKTLSREDGKIDWTKSAEEIERMVRAYNPWPGTWMEYGGKRLKILETIVLSIENRQNPIGTRIINQQKPCIISGQETVIALTKIQLEGKQPMSGEDFITGHTWSHD